MTRHLTAAAAALALGLTSLAAVAQDQPGRSISLELNNLAQADTACRVTFLARNSMGVEIGELAVEIVLFDKNGQVSNILTLQTGRLTDGKSRVKPFLLRDIACDGVSQILVNDVSECSGEGLTPQACLDAITVSSKASIPLLL